MIYSMTAFARLEIKKDWAMQFGKFVRLTNVIWKTFSACQSNLEAWKMLCVRNFVKISLAVKLNVHCVLIAKNKQRLSSI